MAIKQHSAKK